MVSSYHHQAIDRLGAGLVVTGRAEDGVIEVAQHIYAPILAVQWHPEDDADVQPYEQALFDAVVDPSIGDFTHPVLTSHTAGLRRALCEISTRCVKSSARGDRVGEDLQTLRQELPRDRQWGEEA